MADLTRRLNLHPADLLAGADELFELPRQREVPPRRRPGAARDALTLITALAHAESPLTADGIALALSWSGPRLDIALDHAHTHPDTGGALVLRHVPPDGYTATARLDVLRPDQAEAIAGRKNPRPDIRGPIQPVEAEVLLRVWVDGGIDTADAAQRQALDDLTTAEMVTRGDIVDRSTTTSRTACGCSPSHQRPTRTPRCRVPSDIPRDQPSDTRCPSPLTSRCPTADRYWTVAPAAVTVDPLKIKDGSAACRRPAARRRRPAGPGPASTAPAAPR